MKKELFMTHAWEERIRDYMQRTDLGNDYTIIDRYSLGGGYAYPCRGLYDLEIFCLYGLFPTLHNAKISMRRTYLTLICLETINYPDERETAEYGYHFHHVISSIFTWTFNLRKMYHLIKERRFATALGGIVTNEQWEVIKAHYNYTCLRCRKSEPEIKLTVDHIIPRSKGGTSILSNIQPLCERCNTSKNAREIDYREAYRTALSVVE